MINSYSDTINIYPVYPIENERIFQLCSWGGCRDAVEKSISAKASELSLKSYCYSKRNGGKQERASDYIKRRTIAAGLSGLIVKGAVCAVKRQAVQIDLPFAYREVKPHCLLSRKICRRYHVLFGFSIYESGFHLIVNGIHQVLGIGELIPIKTESIVEIRRGIGLKIGRASCRERV